MTETKHTPDALAAERAMVRRMLGREPWTAYEIGAIAEQHGFGWRKGDALIQKWRRNGWATFRRDGRMTYWTATDAGHHHNAPIASPAAIAKATGA